MRELKFRQPIWIKGEFGGWHHWGFLTSGNFSGPNTGSSTITKAQEESQQFTGLLDKQGKEIYEGDIVKIFHRDDNKATIQWDNGEGGFTLRWITPKSEDTEGIIAHVDRRGVEVIGNIYENKDLLK